MTEIERREMQAGDDLLLRRLRLKRVFLWALVASLVTCTAIAVGVLLFGQFNETTARILGTLAALAVHSAIALALAAALEGQRTPGLSRIGLVLFAASFVVLMICVWTPGLGDDEIVRAILSSLALLAAYVLALPSAVLAEHRARRASGNTGVMLCALALLMTLVCIWADGDSVWFAKATAAAAFVAFSLAHTNLLVALRVAANLRWLLRSAWLAIWMLCALATLMVLYELAEEVWFRLLGAVAVLDVCATLALVIMMRLRGVQATEELESAERSVALRCPRCRTDQTVPVGASACHACGLKFRVEVEEPRCLGCGYLLWQLTTPRCPECGRAVDANDADGGANAGRFAAGSSEAAGRAMS